MWALLERLPLVQRYYAPFRRWRDRVLCGPGRALVMAGLVLGFMSVDLSFRQAYVFWSFLFGLGMSSFLVTRLQRFRVTIERHAPVRATAGTDVTYGVVVKSTSTGALYDLSVREEDMPAGVTPVLEDDLGPIIPMLPAGESRRVRLTARFESRGIRELPALRVERTCALGITRSGTTLPAASRVIVHPRHHPVQSVDFTTARVYQPGGIPNAATTGESTEFVGLRDYRPGDPLRHINWSAWARTGQPVVREYQGEYYRRVAIVLDTRVRSTVSREADHFEAAVAATASITRYFEEHEYIIDLFAAGPDIYYLQAGRGLTQMDSVMDLLACVEPSKKPSFPRLDGPLCRVLNRLSGLVLVTTDWWPETRAFHAGLLTEVPEIKVLLVRPDAPTLSPDDDVPDPRLLRRIDPAKLEDQVEAL
jgi:uncharacterized protein (DUF58 family)